MATHGKCHNNNKIKKCFHVFFSLFYKVVMTLASLTLFWECSVCMSWLDKPFRFIDVKLGSSTMHKHING